MIYLKNIAAKQALRVPVSGLGAGASVPSFTLRSATGNRDVYALEWQEGVEEPGYLRGTIALPAGLPDGEYEYVLAEGAQVLGSGVAQVGDYQRVPVEPKDGTKINFKQYGR